MTSALLTKLSHKNHPVTEGPQQLMTTPFPVYIDHRKMIIFEKFLKKKLPQGRKIWLL
jgi:hypothetical protein